MKRSSATAAIGARPSRAVEARRLAAALRLLATALVMPCFTACVDDSFDHPLSDERSSRAEPRFVGTWNLMATYHRTDRDLADDANVCSITRHPRAAGLLQIRLLGGGVFRARMLSLDERNFLFIHDDEPQDDHPAAEPAEPLRGWLVACERRDGEAVGRPLKTAALAKGIEAGDAQGGVERRTTSAILPWRRSATVEAVVDLDSPKTRDWLAAHATAALDEAQPIGAVVKDVTRGRKMALLDPQAAANRPAEAAAIDERLLGVTVAVGQLDPLDVYDVEKVDGSMPPRYRFRKDAGHEDGEIIATEIDGVSFLTVTNGGPDGSTLIFRTEFIDPDTLLLVAPEHAEVQAAIDGSLLPSREHRIRPDSRPDRIVTASTDELRACVKARSREWFPDPFSATHVFLLTRVREAAGAVPAAADSPAAR